MNEKYVPYHRWTKLTKVEKEEFNYKFEAKLDNISMSDNFMIGSILGLLLITALSTISMSLIATIGGDSRAVLPITTIGGIFVITLTCCNGVLLLYYKFKIDKWLEEKGV